MSGRRDTVLVVDDDPVVVDRFRAWLDDDYDVLTALDGETALGTADEADVVLLDRRLPDMEGREVASRIFELKSRPVVAIVSGVRPDTDIVEWPCDEYLIKPMTGQGLGDAVQRLFRRAEYGDALAEYTTLASKRAAIESSQPMDELVSDPEYDELCKQCESKRRELDGIVQGFEAKDFETAFKAPEFNAN
jgi:DNA-binding response OmpR family regulator